MYLVLIELYKILIYDINDFPSVIRGRLETFFYLILSSCGYFLSTKCNKYD